MADTREIQPQDAPPQDSPPVPRTVPPSVNRRPWIEYGNFVVLAFTLMVVCWYTIETLRLRVTTQEQLACTHLPLVVIDFKRIEKYENQLLPIIRNVGFGPAFNIRVSNIKNGNCSSDFQLISGLGENQEQLLSFWVSCEYTGGSGLSGGSSSWGPDAFKHLLRDSHGKSIDLYANRFPVTVTFLDSREIEYQIIQEVQCKNFSDERDLEMQAIILKLPVVQ